MARVLVVDDDAGIRESAVLALEKAGHDTLQAADANSALQLLRRQRVDVVLSDIYMPGEDGLSLLQAIGESSDPPRVILMTARGTIETTAIAQKHGAFDYIAKPFELADLVSRVSAAARKRAPASVAVDEPPPSRIVGSHPLMVGMYKAITRVASLPVPVLILGESGSGKELVAQSIHDLGVRSDAPFIPINCGAIPDTLLENELFGSMRGAYTDARQDRRGALSRANGGTLFLDEIGDISSSFQVKLLRFLQDGMVTPLGSEKSIRADVRVIAATHRDVKRLVATGAFREDLYYRLAGYEIAVPPLRHRKSDIPLLVGHFKTRIATEMHKEAFAGPSQSFLDALAEHDWPGNVRELEQVIRRTAIDSGTLTDGEAARQAIRTIAPQRQAIPEKQWIEESVEDPLVSLDEAEKRHIIEVLRATAGNQTQAAFILGIERKTLARKMKKLGISFEQ
jgi:DNA-binding NtrC family response regulator